MKTEVPDDQDGSSRNAALVVSDGVLGAAVLVILGTNGGGWLDQHWHTAPWFSIGLALLGGGLGLARLVAKANSLDRKSKPK